MKCLSVVISQRADGTARLAFSGGGRVYCADGVDAGRVVWLASLVLSWDLEGLLFDECGGMARGARADLIVAVRACGGVVA